jgi:hypothetical protein
MKVDVVLNTISAWLFYLIIFVNVIFVAKKKTRYIFYLLYNILREKEKRWRSMLILNTTPSIVYPKFTNVLALDISPTKSVVLL